MLRTHDTQRLTRASFVPIATRRPSGWLAGTTVALLALAAVAGVLGLALERAAPARVTELERRNASLTAELGRVRLELDMEHATRAELERQIDSLNAQIGELRHQVGFLNSRKPD